EVHCLRCHKVKGEGGEVGPDLSDVGKRQKREYLLESVLDPNKEIAKGFETLVLIMADGRILTGVLKGEDDKEIRLITPDAKMLTADKRQIDERSRGKSAMPDDAAKHLSRRELRDLVEFLASLTGPPPPSAQR